MKKLVALCLAGSLTGCMSIKDTATDAVAEAWKNIKPDLVATGKELADHASRSATSAASEFLATAKTDIGGALSSIPDIAKGAGEKAAANAIAARLEADNELRAKSDEFRKRVESDGLPAALEWLFGGGGLAITMGLARLWWRTRGALKATVQGVESAPMEAAAQVKAAVRAKGGINFDREIQSALK